MRAFRLLALASLLSGCTKEVRAPEAEGTPNAAVYALAFPRALERATSGYENGRTRAAELCAGFAASADGIKDPFDAEAWTQVLDAAERDGRRPGYVEAVRGKAVFTRVLGEGDEEIIKRTAGAAEFAAKEGGCSKPPEVGGAAANTLRKTSDKRLDERVHDASEAHYLIVRDTTKLGKANVAVAGKQADAIAEASYLVYIALPTFAVERERMQAERSLVLKTLDRQVEDEKARANDDKKSSEERTRRLEAARESLAANDKPFVLADSDKELEALRTNCKKALDDLRDAIKKKK
jgi:hypothetical protein